jgi:hypothetical protein
MSTHSIASTCRKPAHDNYPVHPVQHVFRKMADEAYSKGLLDDSVEF